MISFRKALTECVKALRFSPAGAQDLNRPLNNIFITYKRHRRKLLGILPEIINVLDLEGVWSDYQAVQEGVTGME